MKLGSRQRGLVLAVLLMGTLSAAAWVREGDKSGDSEIVEAPARKAATPKPAASERSQPAADRVHLEKLHARAQAGKADDAFAIRSWRKPPPKVPAANVAVAPTPPSAPPLPFAYLGRLETGDARQVFVTQGERNLILHEGDTLDSTYRVEKFSESGVTFLHMPTGIRQDLPIPRGDAQ